MITCTAYKSILTKRFEKCNDILGCLDCIQDLLIDIANDCDHSSLHSCEDFCEELSYFYRDTYSKCADLGRLALSIRNKCEEKLNG